MPHNIAIKLLLPENFSPPVNPGQQLHGFIFNLLRTATPDLSKTIHDKDGPKGFAISGIRSRKINEGRCFWWRISTPDDHLGVTINDAINEAVESKAIFQLGQCKKVEIAKFAADDLPSNLNTHYLSYEELVRKADRRKKIRLEFATPTAFNISGDARMLPEPSLCFKHYLRQWTSFDSDRFQKNDIQELVKKFKNNIMLRNFSSQSRVACMKGYIQRGFVGTATFELVDLDDNSVCIINALADFAFYCGTGYKTTMGMGQTIRRA